MPEATTSCSNLSIFGNGPTQSPSSCSSEEITPPAAKCSRSGFSPLSCPWRRRSSEKKMQRVLNALAPFRLRTHRSASDLTRKPHPRQNGYEDCEKNDQLMVPNASLTAPIVHPMGGSQYSCTAASPEDNLTGLHPLLASHMHRLDHDLSEPDASLRELRCKWPKSFTNLVASYLNFLEFDSGDLFRIADEVGKQEKKHLSRAMMGSPITRSVFTPIRFSNRFATWGSGKAQREEMAQWYTVVYAMINYLLENDNYCKKFIFRRPGVQTQVNELEKVLFSQKNQNYGGRSDDIFSMNSSPSVDPRETLARYDVLTVASAMTRILRRHGPLIPKRLHCLFTQLADDPQNVGGDTNSLPFVKANCRRALRLLLQLIPSRHLSLIYRPLFYLLTKVNAEPICEMNDTSLAVLFAPVFLLDREMSNPASMANPKLPQVVRLLLELAKHELISVDATAQSLFKVPRLFLYDCHQNLLAHEECDDPPQYCSLRYCATMTTRQRPKLQSSGMGKKRSASTDTLPSILHIDPLTNDQKRISNKSTFSPTISPPLKLPLKDPSTPIIKRPLHCAHLNFRVRRTPCKPTRNKLKAPMPVTPGSIIDL